MTKETNYIDYLNTLNDAYMEDYKRQTGRTDKSNISCIYANETHTNGTDNKPSMGYMQDSKKYHCNTCNKVAGIIDLIKYDNNYTTDKQAIDYLKRQYPNVEYFKNNNYNKYKTAVQPVKKIPSVDINTNYDFTDLIEKTSERVFNDDKKDISSQYAYKYYTEKRGLTDEIIKKYKLGVTDDVNDLLKDYPNLKIKSNKSRLYKLILPILDEQGNCYNFIPEITKREETDDYNSKYRKLNTQAGITTQLFNEYHLKQDRPSTIFIVEGIYDAISIEQMGFKAVALIGIGHTRLENLLKYYKPNANLIVMLDNDETGKKHTINMLNMLKILNMENIKYINGIDILDNYKHIAKCKDSNEMLIKDSDEFKQFLTENERIANKNEDTDRIDDANILNHLEYFKNIENEPVAKMISTGFKKLDENFKGGLRTGLYILGAVSNLGKTAFMLQLADQIAVQKQPVLYFSLEMDKKELMARSISRNTYIQVKDNTDKNGEPIASTTFDILDNGKYKNYGKDKKDTIDIAINVYGKTAKNLYIVSGRYKTKNESRRITIDDIENIIKTFIKYKKQTPVIFIDYMQIIAPIDSKATDKQNMDEVVDRLKQISIDVDTPVIAISSYNRDNYYEPANVSAFKESGAIEYGADNILALQYQGIDYIYYGTKINKNGNKVAIYSTEAIKKRAVYELIEDYKLKSNDGEPIPIELKLLKSRNSSKFNMAFSFKAQYGFFKEEKYKEDYIKKIQHEYAPEDMI